ncbi:MAG TPA: NAD(P)/FAD-dependent oxidoreductase [Gemmatimonadaceae bacterium]|nr:NAD(P)/FAD-dependent oxidoreductase [Gemmatimonadaceae bacterium]
MANGYDVIVIGASADGLVAATALAKAGKRVLVVDSATAIGGESRAFEFAPGFVAAPFALDAGWVPPVVARGIGVAPPPSVAPEFSVTVATNDGFLALPVDASRAATAIKPHSTRDAARWPAFVSQLRKLSGFLEVLYQTPAPDVDAVSFSDLSALLGVGGALRGMGREDMTELLRALPMSVQDFLDDHLESTSLKAAVGAGGVRDLRQGARSGGTTFNLLHYIVGAPAGSVRARSRWKGGWGAFGTVLFDAARAAGVTIKLGRGVARILVRDDAVTGVLMDDAEEIFARDVVSTLDPSHTMLRLVDPVWLDPEFIRAVRNIRYRGCTALVLYAVDKLPEVPGLDSVVSLTPTLTDLERAYDAAKYRQLSQTPHVELTAPSLRWGGMAPEGKHVVVARVSYDGREASPEPRALNPDDDVTARAASVIARHLPSFENSVLARAVLTPHDIEARFGLTGGTPTHGEVALDQILFMRPVAGSSRYAMPIDGLYLGGPGAHPGPGVTGAAGWLAARALIRNKRKA